MENMNYRSSAGVLAGLTVISGGGRAIEDVEADAAAPGAEDARAFRLGQRTFISKIKITRSGVQFSCC